MHVQNFNIDSLTLTYCVSFVNDLFCSTAQAGHVWQDCSLSLFCLFSFYIWKGNLARLRFPFVTLLCQRGRWQMFHNCLCHRGTWGEQFTTLTTPSNLQRMLLVQRLHRSPHSSSGPSCQRVSGEEVDCVKWLPPSKKRQHLKYWCCDWFCFLTKS